jgi:hypothetical protein
MQTAVLLGRAPKNIRAISLRENPSRIVGEFWPAFATRFDLAEGKIQAT